MSEIADFLLERIAEDEALARAAIKYDGDGMWSVAGEHPIDECRIEGLDITIYDEGGHDGHQARHIANWDPVRVLAECNSKRELLDVDIDSGFHPAATEVVQVMAAVYKDHPDYPKEKGRHAIDVGGT